MNVSENYYSPRARGSRQEEEVNEDVASMVTVLADLTSNLLTFIDSISGKIPLIHCVSSRYLFSAATKAWISHEPDIDQCQSAISHQVINQQEVTFERGFIHHN